MRQIETGNSRSWNALHLQLILVRRFYCSVATFAASLVTLFDCRCSWSRDIYENSRIAKIESWVQIAIRAHSYKEHIPSWNRRNMSMFSPYGLTYRLVLGILHARWNNFVSSIRSLCLYPKERWRRIDLSPISYWTELSIRVREKDTEPQWSL